jgi:hypothetical protein
LGIKSFPFGYLCRTLAGDYNDRRTSRAKGFSGLPTALDRIRRPGGSRSRRNVVRWHSTASNSQKRRQNRLFHKRFLDFWINYTEVAGARESSFRVSPQRDPAALFCASHRLWQKPTTVEMGKCQRDCRRVSTGCATILRRGSWHRKSRLAPQRLNNVQVCGAAQPSNKRSAVSWEDFDSGSGPKCLDDFLAAPLKEKT